MNIKTISRDLWLLTNFYNGWEMVRYLRNQRPVSQAILLNGKTILHPPNKGGLVECILELWFTKSYFPDGFYAPKADDVIIDIGANIGIFTLQAARINPDCRIAAFEPFPENFACLSQNISSFKLKNTIAYQYAIGNSYREDLLVEMGTRSLDHKLLEKTDKIPILSNCSSVNTIPLAAIFDMMNTQEIALLKIDIEGAEKEVFASTPGEFLKRVNLMVIEYHDNLSPGTLALITEKLKSTHHLNIIPSELSGCGLLFAMRQNDLAI